MTGVIYFDDMRGDGTSAWEQATGTRQRLLTMRRGRPVARFINQLLARA